VNRVTLPSFRFTEQTPTSLRCTDFRQRKTIHDKEKEGEIVGPIARNNPTKFLPLQPCISRQKISKNEFAKVIFYCFIFFN